MKKLINSALILACALVFVVSGIVIAGDGLTNAAAESQTGSGSESTYDDEESSLDELGFDTDKMPEDYDPNTADNPFGSDVKVLSTVNELFTLDTRKDVALYGHNAKLDRSWDTFKASKQSSKVSFMNVNTYTAMAAGSFDGNGKKSGVAIAFRDMSYDQKDKIGLRFYDPVNKKESGAIYRNVTSRDNCPNYVVQSELQIATGDFDNDTVDEVAVYVPASKGGDVTPKVEVYDMKKNTLDPYNIDSWQLAWTYALPNNNETINDAKLLWNNVDLTSGDADNDGACDLLITYGASSCAAGTGYIGQSVASKSAILYGSKKGNMLQECGNVSLGTDSLIRVSFEFGDINGDGDKELIMAGQRQAEQATNQTRVLGKYSYDASAEKLVPENIQNLAIVNGTTKDGKFYSNNGYDGEYRSTPQMNTNLAVGSIMGSGTNTTIYLDSVIYSYDETFTIEDELEDSAKGSKIMYDPSFFPFYYEYGADERNYTGASSDCTTLNRVATRTTKGVSYFNESMALHLKTVGSKKTLTRDQFRSNSTTGLLSAPVGFEMVPVDTDMDSKTAKYTGKHYIEYSNPKIYAVLASAPYFQDVANYDTDKDRVSFCETAFGTSEGTGDEYQSNSSLRVGGFCNSTVADVFVLNVSAGYALDREYSKLTEREFAVTYSTEGGEDAVVLYSVPMECFEYEVTGVTTDNDGNTKTVKGKEIVTIPHQPATQTLPMEDYDEIQAHHEELPDVSGNILTSKAGDPSSYPSSTAGFKDAVAYKGDWAGAGFGAGSIEQESSYTKETTEGDFHGGYGGVEIGAHLKIGKFYEGEWGASVEVEKLTGTANVTTHGNSFSGTVANMPRSAKDYGYYFSWKVMSYKATSPDGSEFPVITYLVNDVTEPPRLPDDFDQDFEETTDSQIALCWTYNNATAQSFDIYRYYDFPQGGGEYKVGTVNGSNYTIRKDSKGNTVLDENGKPIKDFEFIDKDLASDTKYIYKIKVNRSKVPPESIFSPPLEARTKSKFHPDITLSSETLKIYPDGVQKLTATVNDIDKYVGKTASYQWQKKEENQWKDMTGMTQSTLPFSKNKPENAGEYRCRVNLIWAEKVGESTEVSHYLSAFTDSVDVEFSKRDVSFGEITAEKSEDGKDVSFAVNISNASDGSVAKPTGMVKFYIEGADADFACTTRINAATGQAVIRNVGTLLDEEFFTDGGYEISVVYQGNAVFYEKEDEETLHYLKNTNEGNWLAAKKTYKFGENIMETAGLYKYKKDINGDVTKEDISNQIHWVVIKDVATGDIVEKYNMDLLGAKAEVPFDERLASRALVEVYSNDSLSAEPLGKKIINTKKLNATLSVKDVTTAQGEGSRKYTKADIVLTGEGVLDGPLDPEKELDIQYFDSADTYLFSYGHEDSSKLVPGRYTARVVPYVISNDAKYLKFYNLEFKDARYIVLGSYYSVNAEAETLNGEIVGDVSLVSPDQVSPVKDVQYQGGTELIFKAEPIKGFTVKQWIIEENGEKTVKDGSSTLTYRVSGSNTKGLGSVNVKAVFTPLSNNLTIMPLGKGTISSDPKIESGAIVVKDTDITFTATPEDGWTLAEWRWVNINKGTVINKGTLSEDKKSNHVTFKMGEVPAILYGVFKRDTVQPELSSNLVAYYENDGSDPTVAIGKEIRVENGEGIPKGTTAVIRTAPGFVKKAGAEWKVTADREGVVKNIDNGCTFKLSDSAEECKVETATERGSYGIDASAEDKKANMSVEIDGEKKADSELESVQSGCGVSITAAPIRGYTFDNWLINGKEVETESNSYGTVLTKNLTAVAKCKAVENKSITLKTAGKGTGKYKITTLGGETVEGTFGNESKAVPCYKGEKIEITAVPGKSQNIVSRTVDGEKQETTEATYEIEDIEEDGSVTYTFEPNTYYSLTLKDITDSETASVLTTAEGNVIKSGDSLKAAANSKTSFYIKAKKEKTVHVYNGETELSLQIIQSDDTSTTYRCTMEDINENRTLTITNNAMFYIRSGNDLTKYLKYIGKTSEYADAVLVDDISLGRSWYSEKLADGKRLKGTFDGNGHSIKGLLYGLGTINSDYSYFGLFSEIGKEGTVKNLTIDSFKIRSMQRDSDTGLLAITNYGTIENCVIKDSTLWTAEKDNAGMVFANGGTIINCKVCDSTIDSSTVGKSGSAAIAKFNNDAGQIKNCYVANLKNIDGNYTGYSLIAREGSASSTQYVNNYYDNGNRNIRDDQKRGTNVWENGKRPSTGYLARMMNEKSGGNNWGISSNKDSSPTPIKSRLSGEILVPYKAVFGTDTQLVYPKNIVVPAKKDTGVEAWTADGRVYGAGGTVPIITKDTEFKPVTDFSKYAARLEIGGVKAEYFEDVNDAFRVLKAAGEGEKTLIVCKSCTLDSESIVLDDDTELKVTSGATFTIGTDVSLVNVGEITIYKSAILDNYGSFYNRIDGTVTLNGRFINRGSFKNDGSFPWQSWIECHPHTWDGWKVIKQPTSEAEGERSHECKACGKVVNEVIKKNPVNPDVDDVNSIKIKEDPAKVFYAVNDDFSTAGMKVVANLKDGSEATIEAGHYNMTLTDLDGNTYNIKDGDTLDEAGTFTVTVIYGDADDTGAPKTHFVIQVASVMNTVTLTDEADKDLGDEVKMTASASKVIKASMTAPETGVKYKWEIEDSDIAEVESNVSDKSTVTLNALKPGTTEVEVSAIDENGQGHHVALPKSFTLTVTRPATKIELTTKNITMNKDQEYQLRTKITPDDSTETLTWKSSNSANVSVDENGKIKALTEGAKETITVTTESGKSDTCAVTVKSVATKIELDKTGETVKEGKSFDLEATLTPEGIVDPITWTTSDPSVATIEEMPETLGSIDINNCHAQVMGNNSGTAVITATTDSGKSATCTVTVSKNATDLKLSEDNKTIWTTDTDKYLTAILTGGQFPDDEITWSSDNTEVLTVPEKGDIGPIIGNKQATLTPLKAGWATVTARTANGLSAKCEVHVLQAATDISIADADKKQCIGVGDEKAIDAAFIPKGSTGEITWTSEDEGIVKVADATPDGSDTPSFKITGIATGKAIVTGTLEGTDPAKTVECEVTVTQGAKNIILNKTSMKIQHDASDTLTATLDPAGSTDIIKWDYKESRAGCIKDITPSTDQKTLTIEAGPLPGTAEITATTETGKTANCHVQITMPATKLELTPTAATIKKGEYKAIETYMEPSDCTDEISWSSDNEAVATVNKRGNVYAEGKGTATITATTESGISQTCAITVIEPAEKIELDAEEMNLGVDGIKPLTASIRPKTTTDKITWKVAPGDVREVNFHLIKGDPGYEDVENPAKPGEPVDVKEYTTEPLVGADAATLTTKLKGLGEGIATVTATTESGLEAECIVTVKRGASSVELLYKGNPVSGGTLQIDMADYAVIDKNFTAKVIGDERPPQWSGTDAAILNVNNEGVVTARTGGWAGVTVETDNGMSDYCVVRVHKQSKTVKLDKTAMTAAKGRSYQLNPSLAPVDSNDVITWTSSNESVATVSSDGKVETLGSGDTVIKATPETTGTAPAECSIHVQALPTDITLNKSAMTINADKTETLTATLTPADSYREVIWESSNELIATVDKDGTVTGVAPGSAVITAKSLKDGEGVITKTCNVTVKRPATAVKLSAASKSLIRGSKYTLSATLTPADSTDKMTWTTSKKSVATVSSSGQITAKAVGTAKITGKTTSGITATCTVKVLPKKGDTATVSKAKYKVTTAKTTGGNVQYMGPTKKSVKSATIPASIKINGTVYKVTSVGSKAFYKCSKLKTVTVKSKTIKSVSKTAFKKVYAKCKIKVPKANYKSYKKLFSGKGQPKTVKIVKY